MEVKQLPQAIKPRINYRGNYTKMVCSTIHWNGALKYKYDRKWLKTIKAN